MMSLFHWIYVKGSSQDSAETNNWHEKMKVKITGNNIKEV